MAEIKENVKNGKIVSFYFRTCAGRDEKKKQIFKRCTWRPDPKWTKQKARKEAKKVAVAWEAEIKDHFHEVSSPAVSTELRQDINFRQFVEDVWFPLAVDDGQHRTTTIAMYRSVVRILLPHFGSCQMNSIKALQIEKYLSWLRNDYRTDRGKQLAPYSIKHHYDILRIIFI